MKMMLWAMRAEELEALRENGSISELLVMIASLLVDILSQVEKS